MSSCAPLVPFCEYLQVKRRILSKRPEEMIEAYHRIRSWKDSNIVLNPLLESTLSILALYIRRDENEEGEPISRLYFRKLKSFAKLVKVKLPGEDDNVEKMKVRVEMMPDWLLFLRGCRRLEHIPHPTFETLRAYHEFAVPWLVETFWNDDKEDQEMGSTCEVTTSAEENLSDTDELKEPFEKAMFELIRRLLIAYWHGKREGFVILKEINEIHCTTLSDILTLWAPRTSDCMALELQQRIRNHIWSWVDRRERSSLFCSLRVLKRTIYMIVDNVFQNGKVSLVSCLLYDNSLFLSGTISIGRWKSMLQVVANHNKLPLLLKTLFEVVMSDSYPEERQHFAERWLTTLLETFKSLHNRAEIVKSFLDQGEAFPGTEKQLRRRAENLDTDYLNLKLRLKLKTDPPFLNAMDLRNALIHPSPHLRGLALPFLSYIKVEEPRVMLRVIDEVTAMYNMADNFDLDMANILLCLNRVRLVTV